MVRYGWGGGGHRRRPPCGEDGVKPITRNQSGQEQALQSSAVRESGAREQREKERDQRGECRVTELLVYANRQKAKKGLRARERGRARERA